MSTCKHTTFTLSVKKKNSVLLSISSMKGTVRVTLETKGLISWKLQLTKWERMPSSRKRKLELCRGILRLGKRNTKWKSKRKNFTTNRPSMPREKISCLKWPLVGYILTAKRIIPKVFLWLKRITLAVPEKHQTRTKRIQTLSWQEQILMKRRMRSKLTLWKIVKPSSSRIWCKINNHKLAEEELTSHFRLLWRKSSIREPSRKDPEVSSVDIGISLLKTSSSNSLSISFLNQRWKKKMSSLKSWTTSKP